MEKRVTASFEQVVRGCPYGGGHQDDVSILRDDMDIILTVYDADEQDASSAFLDTDAVRELILALQGAIA